LHWEERYEVQCLAGNLNFFMVMGLYEVEGEHFVDNWMIQGWCDSAWNLTYTPIRDDGTDDMSFLFFEDITTTRIFDILLEHLNIQCIL
jgi:hypothetical protein